MFERRYHKIQSCSTETHSKCENLDEKHWWDVEQVQLPSEEKQIDDDYQ